MNHDKKFLWFHLRDILAEVPDPRNKKGNQRHPLPSVFALIVIGLMSNYAIRQRFLIFSLTYGAKTCILIKNQHASTWRIL